MEPTATHRVEELLVHNSWLRRLASSLVGTDSEAEDLVQETWLAALVRGPSRREHGGAWLARVLRNKAISRARTHGARTGREHANARRESLPSTAALAGRADMSRRLVELVLRLPSDTQRILLARYFEGLSSAEIARRLGRPAGTVRSQLKRGLDDLRAQLDAENDDNRERWLRALTPLALPRHGGGGLAWVLAASAGTRAAIGLALVSLAAGVWWLNRGPGAAPPTIAAASEELASEPEEVTEPSPEPAITAADPGAERVAIEAEPVTPTRAIEGRIVHPETREPVVWFELGIVPKDRAEPFHAEVDDATALPDLADVELVRTDTDGRFASESTYASGTFALVPIEDWRVAHPRMEPFPIRQPRPPFELAHDATSGEPHEIELDAGPLFVIDCPQAVELGTESMVVTWSYIDHFPPGYFRPSPLQAEPVPFVRMHTDFAPSHKKQANNLRLVSTDGLWSASVPMTIPASIATQHLRFDLKATALVDVALDFGERKPPFFLELHYWNGVVDPTAEGTPEPDIVEIQAMFDGTDLERAILKYAPTGTATIGIDANTSEYWFQVAELSPGRNPLNALVLPRPDATGTIEGRVVYVGDGAPEPIVRVLANATYNGEPTFQSQDLAFAGQGDVWVAEFTFTHLPPTAHTIWFDKGGPASHEPKSFAVEPSRLRVEVDGPQTEFELITDLRETRVVVRAVDAVTGDKVKRFAVAAVVPGILVRTREADTKLGRASLKLLGDLEGGFVSIGAEGYIRRDVPLSDAVETSKGLELELALTPGWGCPVYAYADEDEEPLPGVRVLLDGVDHGVTDASGQLKLEAPVTPERVDFEMEGYEVLRQSGWIDSDGEILPVGLSPLERSIGVRMKKRD